MPIFHLGPSSGSGCNNNGSWISSAAMVTKGVHQFHTTYKVLFPHSTKTTDENRCQQAECPGLVWSYFLFFVVWLTNWPYWIFDQNDFIYLPANWLYDAHSFFFISIQHAVWLAFWELYPLKDMGQCYCVNEFVNRIRGIDIARFFAKFVYGTYRSLWC